MGLYGGQIKGSLYDYITPDTSKIKAKFDWGFKHWCLIKNTKEFIESKGGNRVLKFPNKNTRQLSNRIKYII